MHLHVRRNAYMYTTADLAMTAIDCNNYTLKEALDNHSGGSSGIADCTKETYLLPIQQAALNKLGLGCGGVVAPVRAVESSENQD
jgi:S-adenosylhomocysteine hydrolase